MRKLIITSLFVFNMYSLFAQDMSKENQKIVADFIAEVKNPNKNNLCSSISFPFKRQYPIPDINNRHEFLKRYKEVFDDSLTKMILTSDPAKDWAAVGWRGIMLLNGVLWIDYNGRFIGVNYQSKCEKEEYERLVRMDKSRLYESVNKFEKPMFVLETSKHQIRIDDMGNDQYRYVSWPLKSKMNKKPELVIENGQIEFEGTGGNSTYTFKNAGYIYQCSIIVMGEESSPPAKLTILKGNKTILTEDAKLNGN
ncbi:MAG TPA: hypothetical protein VK772_05890 [Puia sp.]|jgi:hypothetical protein|nr:hypothetical protein [Puia sp.]